MLEKAIAEVPTGRWAVGVSGGADSVALLTLLAERRDLHLHVVHLDHQTRGAESDADAAFVRSMADRLGLPVTVERLETIKPLLKSLPTNRSALYRLARLALFASVVTEARLVGVVLAHHRLDLAETVLLRLMRGASPMALAGMSPVTMVNGLTIHRPLLDVPPERLRAELVGRRLPWREDASNRSPAYRRNRVRMMLKDDQGLVNALVELGKASSAAAAWLGRVTPDVPAAMPTDALDGLPGIVRESAARRWLVGVGVPADEVNPGLVERLLTMLDDAASGARADFPGSVRVQRRQGVVSVTSDGGPSHRARPTLQSPAP